MSDEPLNGMVLATLCDMVLGEDAQDRSNEALMHGVMELLNRTNLADKWEKEASQYQRQVDEARSKGLPHDQMLSMATCLRACAAELRGGK